MNFVVTILCPVCATRTGQGWGTYAVIGAMIAVPYVVTAVALKVIKRISKDA